MNASTQKRDIGRVTKHGSRNAQTSRGRLAVESVLQRAQEPLSPQDVAERVGSIIDLVHVRRILQALRADRVIVNVGTTNRPQYRMRGKTGTSQAPHRSYGAGTYDGAELRPFAGRPGAMDAFACPSLNGDQLTPYRGPRAQCVGAGQPEAFSYSRRGQQ